MVVVFTLALLAAAGTWGTVSQVVWVCPDKIKAICDASEISNEAERTEMLLRLLPEALQSPDRDVRKGAAGVLQKATRELGFDPRPLREAIVQFDKLEADNGGATFLDEFELAHAPREARLRVYMTAIVNAEGHYGSAGVLDRASAMVAAAREGMGELRLLIEQHQPEVAKNDPSGDTRFSLDYLVASLDLRDGADDPADAALRAARRLEAISPRDLWTKLDSSDGWARAFEETNRDTCKETGSDACQTMKRVNARLLEIVRPLMKAESNRRVSAWNLRESPIENVPGPREVKLVNWMRLLTPKD